MNVICLQEAAFYSLVETVVERFKKKQGSSEDKWISGLEAIKRLRIESKATLQKMRDEGVVKFAQPERKIILCESDSINDYLEKHTKKTF